VYGAPYQNTVWPIRLAKYNEIEKTGGRREVYEKLVFEFGTHALYMMPFVL
jgi:hypothetical protein